MKLTIGENIRTFRKKNDLTQEAFADRLGVTYQSVSRWENGAASPDNTVIKKLAYLFDVTTDYLLEVDPVRMKESIREIIDKANENNA